MSFIQGGNIENSMKHLPLYVVFFYIIYLHDVCKNIIFYFFSGAVPGAVYRR